MKNCVYYEGQKVKLAKTDREVYIVKIRESYGKVIIFEYVSVEVYEKFGPLSYCRGTAYASDIKPL